MIKGLGFTHETFKFPVGEMHVKVHSYTPNDEVAIEFYFERTEELVELMLIANALKHAGLTLERIFMPYVPFGRQDRVAVSGECFSLEVFAGIINSLGVVVEIADPHSDVSTALIHNCLVIHQHEIFEPMLREIEPFKLICPDGGARKKINKISDLPSMTNRILGVVECSKKREPRTGAITGTVVYADSLEGDTCVIVDDICDGGKTFIEIAKVLREKGAKKVILMVSHGFFTKGMEVFDGIIDEIYTLKGKVK